MYPFPGGNAMPRKFMYFGIRPLAALMILSAIALSIAAQDDDPDPNSPTPILLTMNHSSRVIASPGIAKRRDDIARIAPQSFASGQNIVVFATNLDLMKGEGASAFRLYAQDSQRHVWRFTVTDIDEMSDSPGIYALTAKLNDEIGFWPEPTSAAVSLYLTWRGNASNPVKLDFGQLTDDAADLPGTVSAPLADALSQKNKSSRRVAAAAPAVNQVGYRWSGDRARFQEQTTFGMTSTQDNSIRRIGLRRWLNMQFETPYPSEAYPNDPPKPSTAPADCDNDQTVTPDVPETCYRDTYSMYKPQTWFMRESLYGNAQLRHRVAWALSQIWVTSGVDIQQGRYMVEYHKILSNNAFGNYRDLMKQMTLNPTMGAYLDMAGSTKTNPNENYAREIMQLFSIGLFMLNQDGTLQTDGNGNPIPTYDQNVVTNLTKVLTGWTYCTVAANCPNYVIGTPNYLDQLRLNNTANHDLTAKTLLTYPGSTTTNIAACTGCTGTAISTYAANSMDQALDNIFNHPNLAPYVSRTLIQQLVTSDPTPAYIGRVAAVFNNNGQGVRGDLKSVVRAILLDPEARGDAKTDPNYGKLREPVLFATNFLRAFGVRSADGTALFDGYITGRGEFTGMSQIPFMSPTVFNYYPPDYKVPGTTLLGPEFAIMNTGTSVTRANFVYRFTYNAIPIAVSAPNSPTGLSLDLTDLQTIAAGDSTANQLVDELNRRLMHGTMSSQMKAIILPAVTSITATDTLGRVRQAIYLVATSSQFQVQR